MKPTQTDFMTQFREMMVSAKALAAQVLKTTPKKAIRSLKTKRSLPHPDWQMRTVNTVQGLIDGKTYGYQTEIDFDLSLLPLLVGGLGGEETANLPELVKKLKPNLKPEMAEIIKKAALPQTLGISRRFEVKELVAEGLTFNSSESKTGKADLIEVYSQDGEVIFDYCQSMTPKVLKLNPELFCLNQKQWQEKVRVKRAEFDLERKLFKTFTWTEKNIGKDLTITLTIEWEPLK